MTIRDRSLKVILMFAVLSATLGAVLLSHPGRAAAGVQGTGPNCKVQLTFTATEAEAHSLGGCHTKGEYWLVSWIAQSDVWSQSHPQYFYATDDGVPTTPWKVALPPCYWQVDFVYRPSGIAPPTRDNGQVWIAGHLGGTSCVTTTTSTTSTTLKHHGVPTTTTTTIPTKQTTTTTTVKIVTTTTSTTLPKSTTTLPRSTTTTTLPHSSPSEGTTTTTKPPLSTGSGAQGGGMPLSDGGGPANLSSGGYRLAFTGANILGMILVGFALIGIGFVFFATSRARRSLVPPAT